MNRYLVDAALQVESLIVRSVSPCHVFNVPEDLCGNRDAIYSEVGPQWPSGLAFVYRLSHPCGLDSHKCRACPNVNLVVERVVKHHL